MLPSVAVESRPGDAIAFAMPLLHSAFGGRRGPAIRPQRSTGIRLRQMSRPMRAAGRRPSFAATTRGCSIIPKMLRTATPIGSPKRKGTRPERAGSNVCEISNGSGRINDEERSPQSVLPAGDGCRGAGVAAALGRRGRWALTPHARRSDLRCPGQPHGPVRRARLQRRSRRCVDFQPQHEFVVRHYSKQRRPDGPASRTTLCTTRKGTRWLCGLVAT